jgi:hypothetical protein
LLLKDLLVREPFIIALEESFAVAVAAAVGSATVVVVFLVRRLERGLHGAFC